MRAILKIPLLLTVILACAPGMTARYVPDGRSAVTCNGSSRFNRALYGSRDGFRVDCSDTPEFGLYLPGMGGNLLLTLPPGDCTARYTPGRMDYSQSGVSVTTHVHRALGIALWQISNVSDRDVTVGVRFGGVSGKKFSRSGDLGVDPPDCFDLKPEYCLGNTFTVNGRTVSATFGDKTERTLHLIIPADTLTVTTLPSVEGIIHLFPGESRSLGLFPPEAGPVDESSLPDLVDEAEASRAQLAAGLTLDTPEAWLNPVGGALAVAADAIWGGRAWLHGAIGWRTPHLGWRGAYAGDALGLYDRAMTHFRTYAANQVADTPPVLPHPRQDSALCLARAEKRWGTPMYSDGYICRRPGHKDEMSHYDMNLVFIDALLRHLRHTGDTTAMREFFPTIARHLRWEKRNFDPDGDCLYDAYACIWASDALYYSGGAVTHSSAYNLFANRLTARVAEIIGEDPGPYRREAEGIAQAIDSVLWMSGEGHWAEYKDLAGLGRLHPSAALWTVYHAIDSETADPFRRYAATCYIDSAIPHLPLGNGLSLLATTSWKPYSWSINNVAIAEMMHMALAYWQAGRPEEGFRLMKSVAEDNMYLGASPLNFGQISRHDAARGECYRDFADAIGVWSRAITEGLYGICPDLLSPHRHILIRPGFPAGWDSASITRRGLSYSFRRERGKETYVISNPVSPDADIILEIEVRGEVTAKVNGRKAKCVPVVDAIGSPRVRINAGKGRDVTIEVTTAGRLHPHPAGHTRTEGPVTFSLMRSGPLSWWEPSVAPRTRVHAGGTLLDSVDPSLCETVDLSALYNDSVTAIFRNRYLSPRPDVTTLRIPVQGIGEWCHPTLTADIDDSGLRDLLRRSKGIITLPGGIPARMNADGPNVIYTSLWDNYPSSAEVPLTGNATHLYLTLAGSTNHMQCGIANGLVTVTYADGHVTTLELVNPDNWPPIEQDFYTDSCAFAAVPGSPAPVRLHLLTGHASRTLGDDLGIKGVSPRTIPGGAATVLCVPLDPGRELKSMRLETLSNDVVIGLMSATLRRVTDPTAWYPVSRVNRPFVRWWWHGSEVDADGITYNLEEFARKGFGGVEITPIYGVKGNEEADIPYLSPRWMEMLSHTVREGERLGIQVDMNNGTGWPFGGPDITTDLSARRLVAETYDVAGGNRTEFAVRPFSPAQQGVATLQHIIAVNGDTRLDITTRVGADSILRWDAPPGDWRVYALFSGRTFQKVKRAAPGGEGLVLNHLDSLAVKTYLSRFDQAFAESGAPFPDSFFNDSYEVYGSDWADNLTDEFELDHGYRLEHFIPEFLSETHDSVRARVVRDYRFTLARMLEENFTRPWAAWAHGHGATVRNQSHGSPANILDLYADVDIPECESFGQTNFNIPGLHRSGPGRPSDAEPAVLKFASSAAHLTGRRHTSAEALTWLTEHFHTTLARSKPELDQLFCSGVNHVVLHGATYSPPDAPFPGRLFYASVNMSPTFSLWPYAGELSDYIARVQSFLSAGEPDNDFLLYFPQEHLWQTTGGKPLLMFDIHRMNRTMPDVKRAVRDILKAGYDVDYVSDRLLLTLRPDSFPYKAILIPERRDMPSATASMLDSLSLKGIRVVYADTVPADMEPEPLRRDFGATVIRRRNEAGGHNYFIAMLDSLSVHGWVPLAVPAADVMIFDPLTGRSGLARTLSDSSGRTSVYLDIDPGESLMLKTFPDKVSAPVWKYLTPSATTVAIDRGWSIGFIHSEPPIEGRFRTDTLTPWTRLPHPAATVNSGTALYSTRFTLPAGTDADDWRLDLGDLREAARVRINGLDAGTVWCLPYRLNVGSLLHEGENLLEIEVTSLDANRIADYERRGVEWRVFKDANIASVTGAKHFSFADWDTVPCGLNSAVTLTPLKSIQP